jgi:hypothetical protein
MDRAAAGESRPPHLWPACTHPPGMRGERFNLAEALQGLNRIERGDA